MHCTVQRMHCTVQQLSNALHGAATIECIARCSNYRMHCTVQQLSNALHGAANALHGAAHRVSFRMNQSLNKKNLRIVESRCSTRRRALPLRHLNDHARRAVRVSLYPGCCCSSSAAESDRRKRVGSMDLISVYGGYSRTYSALQLFELQKA
jgi:hypothetical protein